VCAPGKRLKSVLKSYKLTLTRQAESALEWIAKHQPILFQKISQILDGLERDPYQGKALKGQLKGRYSYRVATHRIIYSIFQDRLLVVVIDIGHRRDVYR